MTTLILVVFSMLVLGILTGAMLLVDWIRRRLGWSHVQLVPYLIGGWALLVLFVLRSVGDTRNPTHVLVAVAFFAYVAWVFYVRAGQSDEWEVTPRPQPLGVIGPIAFIRKYRHGQLATPSVAEVDDKPAPPTAPVTSRPLHPEEVLALRGRTAHLRRRMVAQILGLSVIAPGLAVVRLPVEVKAIGLVALFWLSLVIVGGFVADRLSILRTATAGHVDVVATRVDAIVPQTGFLLVGGHSFYVRDRQMLSGISPGSFMQVEYIPLSRIILRLNGRPVL